MSKEQNAALEADRVAFEVLEADRADAFLKWYEGYTATGFSVSKFGTKAAFEAGAEWQARAQLAAPAGVPEGWRLAPVEPTEDMLRAGLQYDSEQDPNNPDSRVEELKIDYSLMLAAAPSPAPSSVKPAQVMGRVYDGKAELNSIGRALPDHSPLYSEPAPAGDVAQKPERFKMEPYQTVDKGSTNYKAGWNAAIKALEASDVVQVPRELLVRTNNLYSLGLDIDVEVAELRALLNGGRV